MSSLEDRQHVPGKEAPETMATMFTRFDHDLTMISCHFMFFFTIIGFGNIFCFSSTRAMFIYVLFKAIMLLLYVILIKKYLVLNVNLYLKADFLLVTQRIQVVNSFSSLNIVSRLLFPSGRFDCQS